MLFTHVSNFVHKSPKMTKLFRRFREEIAPVWVKIVVVFGQSIFIKSLIYQLSSLVLEIFFEWVVILKFLTAYDTTKIISVITHFSDLNKFQKKKTLNWGFWSYELSNVSYKSVEKFRQHLGNICWLSKNFKISEFDFIQPIKFHFPRWGLQNTQMTNFLNDDKRDFQRK